MLDAADLVKFFFGCTGQKYMSNILKLKGDFFIYVAKKCRIGIG